jgi:hypothetical protein
VHVLDRDGNQIDATFSVEGVSSPWVIYFESRGGSRGAPNERNTQYNLGLELVLRRLAQLGATLVDASVESRVTRHLSLEERRLMLPMDYPLPLTAADPTDLRRQLGAAQRPIGRMAGARGPGNNTKRIGLVVALDEDGLSAESIAVFLAQGSWRNDVERVTDLVRARLGQAYLADAEIRRAVESHAMEVAADLLSRQGWLVTDVSANHPYDLRCTRDGETGELHVEVKGTMGAGERILLTANEVRHARSAFPEVALVVVSGITFTDGRAEGGEPILRQPWDVNAGELTPTAFTWAPS